MNWEVEPSLLFSGSQKFFFFFPKYLVELTSEAIWAWSLFSHWKIFRYKFDFLSRYRSTWVFHFFLSDFLQFLFLKKLGSSDSKESACSAGDQGPISGLGRSSEEENGNPLQYSCLENSMDRGAWQAAFHGVSNSWT